MFLDSTTSSGSGGTLFAVVLFIVYFLPSALAGLRDKLNPGGVYVINIFLGWTVLGWVIALAMAASGPTKKQAENVRQIPAPPHVSPDGHWWWDGRQWQPMPPSRPPGG